MSLGSGRYVALGDSTAAAYGVRADEGYVARIHRRAAGGTLRLINLADSGARSACVLRDQLPHMPAAPALITVGVGVNDVVHGTDLARLGATWGRMGNALARTGAAVVVGNLPDLSLAPVAEMVPRKHFEGRIAAINRIIGDTCAQHGFELADLHGATSALGLDGVARRVLFCSDGFHPSAAGYLVLARVWFPVVDRALAAARRTA